MTETPGSLGDLVELMKNVDIFPSGSSSSESIEADLTVLKDKGIVNLIVLLGKEKSPWEVGRTKTFHSLLRSGAEPWIQPLAREYRTSPEFKKIFDRVVLKIVSATHIPEFGDREFYKYEQSDFGCAEVKASHTMELLKILFKLLLNVHAGEMVRDVTKIVGKDIVILVTSNMEVRPWTSDRSVKSAEELLGCLMEVNGCNSLGQLLVTDIGRISHSDDSVMSSNTLFKSTFKELQPRLIKGTWKRNPSFVASAVYCLFHLDWTHFGEYLDDVLPISLLLVDDYVLENKVLGVRCLHHIIKNTTKTELQWHGRSDVIYEAVKHQLYTHEVELVLVSHPCILAILKVVEISPKIIGNVATVIGNLMMPNKYDEVLTMILCDAETETKLVLRRAYTQNLANFIEAMGLTVVKHSKQLLSVITSYLETYDGPQEIARLNTLAVLKSYIIQAWPRLHNHSLTILKSLLRLLYDLSVDDSLTPSSVRKTLVEKTTEILILLKCVCKEEVLDCLSKMLNIETTPLCVKVMQEVLQHNAGLCPHENTAQT